jgi:hypothetical protein
MLPLKRSYRADTPIRRAIAVLPGLEAPIGLAEDLRVWSWLEANVRPQ